MLIFLLLLKSEIPVIAVGDAGAAASVIPAIGVRWDAASENGASSAEYLIFVYSLVLA